MFAVCFVGQVCSLRSGHEVHYIWYFPLVTWKSTIYSFVSKLFYLCEGNMHDACHKKKYQKIIPKKVTISIYRSNNADNILQKRT